MGRTRRVAIVAGLALTLGLTACSSGSGSGSGSTSGGSPSGKAQQGGTVTVAWSDAQPDFVFPYPPATNEDGYNANLTQYLWPYLSFAGDGAQAAVNPAKSLYSSLKFSDGNQTATMVLKSWNWSDGTPITARDFTFTYNLLKANYKNWINYIPGTFPTDVSSVSTSGTHTVVIHLTAPTSPAFFADDVLNNVALIPQHAWDKQSVSGKIGNYDQTASGAKAVYDFLQKQGSQISTFTSNPLWKVVDGPWQLTTFNSDGSLYGYTPNKNYSGADKPHLAKVLNQSFTSSTALIDALRSGNSVQVGGLPLDDVNQLGRLKAQGYSYSTVAIPGVSGMEPNLYNSSVGAVLRQLPVRQAMEELINRPQIVSKVYNGYADPSNGPISVKAYPNWASPLEKSGGPYPYKPQAAIALLKAHGWKVVPGGVSTCAKPGSGPGECGAGIAAGQKLEFQVIYPSGSDTTDEMNAATQSSERQAGVKLDLKTEPFNTMIGTIGACTAKSHTKNCGWQIIEFGYDPFGLYPADNGVFATGGTSNLGGWSDPKADSLIKATLRGSSTTAFYNYENYVAQQLPFLWMPLREGIELYKSNIAKVSPMNSFTPAQNFSDWYLTK
jgi:peptide/nickel transport system substrate-binding protein